MNNAAAATAILCPYCEEADFVDGQCPACCYFPLKGEGEVTVIKRTARRVGCGRHGCGNVATQRHTYLLEGGRRNPRSKAYGGDDVSWCSDHEEFTCGKCKRPSVDGYEPCSTFSITPTNFRFAHLFLERKEEPSALGAAAPALLAAAQSALTFARYELELREPSGDPEYIGYAKKAVADLEAAISKATNPIRESGTRPTGDLGAMPPGTGSTAPVGRDDIGGGK